MAQHFRLEPRWLDSLLSQWVRHRLREATRGLGYPSINASCKENLGRAAQSYEPTGFCAADFTDLEAAWESLDQRHQASLKCAYMPWTREAMRQWLADTYGERSERTLRNWIHEGMAQLAARMDRQREAA